MPRRRLGVWLGVALGVGLGVGVGVRGHLHADEEVVLHDVVVVGRAVLRLGLGLG